MVIKALEKGARARAWRRAPLPHATTTPQTSTGGRTAALWFAGREEHLADYHARKASVEAAETKMWDEELALHKVDTDEAEKSVHRQRALDWKLRERPEDFAVAMLNMRFPFHVSA